MKKKLLRGFLALTLLLTTLTTSGCSLPGLSSAQGSGNTVRIASLNTTESQIIANIISELIDHETNYQTSIVNNLGSAPLMHQALIRGDADIQAVSYSGTELTTTLNLPPTKNADKATKTVAKTVKKRYNQTLFPTYGFENKFAFMVTQQTAQKDHLQKVSDLNKIADSSTIGVDANWLNRKGDGYKDFTKYYGFEFVKAYPMQIGLVYSALASKKMDVVLGYSTDGRVDSYHLKQLQDDKKFFPPYKCSMLVNNSLLKKDPQLKPILHRLDNKIDVHTMRKLNYQVDDQLLEPQVVAQKFLQENHYFRGDK
ncbi:osmoprotectant ABC transporter substrate-binding protein [Bombilactobacillus folatiphilus]|uniref:Osmoprotectant ABC transporter substrate-binding protein n=1 Tax=Bombilactobacillus folatiphilus TaxID=2923362 RepID=A0ABY4P990_9LACO|nr:osmoprotectant ABC transporter substrate-binding protein [Bombilactobacillus folatiphilus]UQS82192.1 osmoprotectant ABC transporter substrate-binding protein [Bombilactobacillus folatiphilus]